ncbi:MAG TPA: cbb3-type cytochrome c oxidase subunit I [Candidatus Limnocylindria bacterium]|nr:cbb3-type cytochrome c oxidase subunit I [Candidatus Limnocylindria bacterium]
MARPSSAALDRAWRTPAGIIGWLGAVNHKPVGARFVATAIFFFLIGGLDSLVLRTQLAVPENDLVGAPEFAQLFTTHGTAMMFFFAVPMVEGLGMYFVPLMIGARDMPFPRLNALGYWLFLFGGLLLYFPTLADIANFFLPGDPLPRHIPDGGWFAYPPLTSAAHSPDLGLDFWLIAVTMAEISAIIGAVEIVVCIARNRAPGMTWNRLPLFVWSILAIGIAILLAFPSIVTGSVLLELERKLALPFYDAALGGQPLLWQHLFWIFGHPEVYIQFLPATGVVSMILVPFTRRPIVAYGLIVVAILSTALFSLGLWVHHMFATGLPWLGLTIFSASSMMIAIPSGIQVFAWLATLLAARRLQLNTAMLFVLGFLLTFTFGGLTGVMVASVPFDLQAHDTYFVTAHFHYVLVGGVVFPIFAGIYYWFPKVFGRLLDERLGKLAFWLTFIGFNATFLLQHNLGLLGMRRRVHTYEAGLGWDEMNFISTVGAFVFAAGFLLILFSMFRAWRGGPEAGPNPWRASTLEWATASPPESYNFRVIPDVRSREPLWHERGEPQAADFQPAHAGDWAPAEGVGGQAEGSPDDELSRETLATSLMDTRPVHNVILPGTTIAPLALALMIAVAGFAFIADLYLLALPALLAMPLIVGWWLWPRAEDLQPVNPGRTLGQPDLPWRVSGPVSTPWWGLALGLGVVGLIVMNLVFSYLYLALLAPAWPPSGQVGGPLPLQLVALGLVLLGAVAARLALRWARGGSGGGRMALAVAGSVAVGLMALALLLDQALAHLPDPRGSSYAAMQWVLTATRALLLLVIVGVSAAVAVQAGQGLFDRQRLMALDHVVLLWYFVVAAWLVILAVAYLLPPLGAA